MLNCRDRERPDERDQSRRDGKSDRHRSDRIESSRYENINNVEMNLNFYLEIEEVQGEDPGAQAQKKEVEVLKEDLEVQETELLGEIIEEVTIEMIIEMKIEMTEEAVVKREIKTQVQLK